MTVAQYETIGRDLAPVYPADSGPRRLVEWAQEAAAAHDLAVALCATSFCPQAFQGKPGEATAAILAGSEVGLSPLAALNAYDVIQGRPAPKAITLRALVQSAGHEVWLESATDARVIMHGRRRGESQVQTSDWSLTRANKLGLTTKPNWKSQPQAMLTARATSEICRLVGADVILGIPYSAEELVDLEPEPTTTTTRAPRTTTAKRAAAPEPVEPSFDDSPQTDGGGADPITLAGDSASRATPSSDIAAAVDQDEKYHGEPPASAKQKGMYRALVGEKLPGISRDDLLAMVTGVIGHDVESSNDLTMSEMGKLIDHLDSLEATS